MSTAASPTADRRQTESDARRHLGKPSEQYAELAAFERAYTIERFTQRELMLKMGAFLWFLTLPVAMLAGQYTDDPNGPFPAYVRYAIIAISAAFVLCNLTLVRRLDDERTNRFVFFTCVMALGVYFVLSFYGPGSLGAMTVTQISVTIFAAQFLGGRQVVAIVSLVTATTAGIAYFNYGSADAPHILSQNVLITMVLWAVAYSVYVLKHARASALAAAERIGFDDSLTGLPNTRMMRRRAGAMLDARNERINRRTGLIVLDLDGFRAANMLRGRRIGDRMLVAVADAMTEVASPGQIVSRTGSDEFSVLVPDCSKPELASLADRLRSAALDSIARLAVPGIKIDASVGFALSDGAITIDELMREAEHSMYLQKAAHERIGTLERTNAGPDAEFDPAPSTDPRGPAATARWDHLRWSNRSDQNRVLASFWVLSAFGVFLAMRMPDAIDHAVLLVNLTVVFAFVAGIVIYLIPPAEDFPRQLVDVALASITLSFTIWITGKPASPAVPVQFLVLIYIGWFLPLSAIVPVSIASTFVVAAPTLIVSNVSPQFADGVAIYGGMVVAIGLLAALYHNKYYILRARELSNQLSSLDLRAGAYSRRAFEERMDDELDRLSYADRDALAVVMIDLGNFKGVAANHGRLVADELLREVAEALATASRDEDCVARLGGDEFAVVAPGVDAESARDLSQRLIGAVRASVETSKLGLRDEVRPSVGFSLYGMHGRTTDELVTAADVALTAAKTSARDPDRVSSFVVAL